jgi:hypothetical protein
MLLLLLAGGCVKLCAVRTLLLLLLVCQLQQ